MDALRSEICLYAVVLPSGVICVGFLLWCRVLKPNTDRFLKTSSTVYEEADNIELAFILTINPLHPMIAALINAIILFAISLIHVYWSVGGKWGLSHALPEQNGAKALQPGPVITLAVALVLSLMSLFYGYKAGQLNRFESFVPAWISQYGLWFLCAIFLFRAIGDFRYVGFFKRIRNSRFARLDTWFYSPLCLLLSINTLIIIAFPVHS